ncbi:MAG: transcription elongation factor GreB [Myxococcales bacterium]|nr:transcription elongation factor GreB [Myxococcales bacterium]
MSWEDELRPGAPPRNVTVSPPDKKAHITPEGYRALQAELDYLWGVERPKVTNEVSEAAALGDRSENAEYIYGKKRLREIDRRLRYLTRRLDAVTVWDRALAQPGRAFFGAWVTLEPQDDDDDGDGDDAPAEVTYRLVGPDEVDVKAQRISVESPLARALLGKSEGDEVVVRTPRGRQSYVVLGVSYEGQDARK